MISKRALGDLMALDWSKVTGVDVKVYDISDDPIDPPGIVVYPKDDQLTEGEPRTYYLDAFGMWRLSDE